ncbi:MAG: UbiA family prenyltransferase [Saprospiraceae bacterium]|nr:UbiA family prenyltransferase [Saprospiraceae bacterium]
MDLKSWSSFLRLPNLFMILFGQQFIFYFILNPQLPVESETLSGLDFLLLSFTTVLVAAGGFVINNVFDAKIDAIFPGKNPVPLTIKPNVAIIIYLFIVFTGLGLTILLAVKSDRLMDAALYPAAVLLLFIYSWKLKCLPVIGNLFVALFTSAVIYIIPFAYWEEISLLRMLDYSLWKKLLYPLFMLGLFAFLVNFIREVVKDIEDIKSDANSDCKSTAVYYGEETAMGIVRLFWILLLLILSIHVFQTHTFKSCWVFLLCLGIPLIWLSLFIFRQDLKSRITFVSRGLKLLMLAGMIYWIIY